MAPRETAEGTAEPAAGELAIGEVARRASLATSAVRYYERIGLIEAPPRVSGRRRYPPAVLDRLALIALAREAGFALVEVRELLDGFPAGTPPGDRWGALVDRKLVEIDALIARARTARRLLKHIAKCDCGDLDECARAMGRRNVEA